MKMLFIVATDTTKKVQMYYPSLGIGYMISVLRQKFGKDAIEFRVINDELEKNIDEFKPDIVGISSVTMNYNIAKGLAKVAKSHSIPVLIGGYHISYVPSSITEDMDVGVIGEGENTICELVELFMRKGKFDAADLGTIDGIIYRADGGVKATKKREIIRPLDNIPLPARDVLEKGEMSYMFTSRGCPYNCAFCSSTRFWGTVRLFSAEYVFNEMKFLIDNYHTKHIHFYDDLFIIDRQRIRDLIRLMEEHGYLGKVQFSGHGRANLIDDEMAMMLKRMGWKAVAMGLESANEETLNYLKGGTVTVADNKRSVELIKKHGMRVHGSFIIGAPKETRAQMMDTFNFIRNNDFDEIFTNLLTPLPGTPVWDYAKARGLVSDDMDWDLLKLKFDDDYEHTIIVSEIIQREEMIGIFKMFLAEERKKYLLRLLKSGITHPWEIPKFLKEEISRTLEVISNDKGR